MDFKGANIHVNDDGSALVAMGVLFLTKEEWDQVRKTPPNSFDHCAFYNAGAMINILSEGGYIEVAPGKDSLKEGDDSTD